MTEGLFDLRSLVISDDEFAESDKRASSRDGGWRWWW
jgi:hypothetical protein